MDTKYPKHEVYEELYKRFFKRNERELVELVNIKENDRVLDVCGGNARLSKTLLDYTKNVSYLDQEKDMTPNNLESFGITVYHSSIEDFVNNPIEKYQYIFCQQAINYWLLSTDIEKFSRLLVKNGTFVFNTFKNKPDIIPMVKQYEIEEKHYLEISYLVENKVYHIQICEGYPPHFTIFDWISEEMYEEILSPYFELEKITDQRTLIYKCKKKS